MLDRTKRGRKIAGGERMTEYPLRIEKAFGSDLWRAEGADGLVVLG